MWIIVLTGARGGGIFCLIEILKHSERPLVTLCEIGLIFENLMQI